MTFSALQELTVDLLKQQLKIRAIVDRRREANGKALVRTPPKKDAAGGEGGRAWLILKLQSLLKLEFSEGLLAVDPNDLSDGDRGCAAAKPKAKQPKAKQPKAKQPKASGAKTPKARAPQAKKPRKQQQQSPADDSSNDESSDDESSDESADEGDEGDVYRVEAILDQRISTAADKKRMGWAVGIELYLVVRQAKLPTHCPHTTPAITRLAAIPHTAHTQAAHTQHPPSPDWCELLA
jgi:hypothetical protein